jgi:hypothetical protein
MHTDKNICNFEHLDIVDSCFTDEPILLRRMARHGKQKTVIFAQKLSRAKIISDMHGNVMNGHESKKHLKERIISSCCFPGMDTGASFTKLTYVSDISFGYFQFAKTHNFLL